MQENYLALIYMYMIITNLYVVIANWNILKQSVVNTKAENGVSIQLAKLHFDLKSEFDLGVQVQVQV